MDVKEGIVYRPLARGGMLVDEPGLGKTITVLSLILQTMGLSTEEGGSSDGHDKGTSDREGGDDEVDDTIFNAYWKESIVPDFRRQALTKLFNDLLRCSADVFYFFEKSDPFCKNGAIKNHFTLKDIRVRIQSNVYGDSFATFQTDVELVFMNALIANLSDSVVYVAAGRLAFIFGRW